MINPLFPTPLYIGKMPNHESLKEKFMEGLKQATFPETNWQCNVDTTFNQSCRNTMDIFPWEEFFAGVNRNISSMAEELKSPPLSISPFNAWVNVYRQGQYQEPHTHVERHTTCSVIYFVNYVHEKDAKVGFRNSSIDHYVYSNFNCFFPRSYEWFTPIVEEGDVLIFPGFLEHTVGKQTGDRARVTVSSNYTIGRQSPTSDRPSTAPEEAT
ncbi:MAG: putative 2OG-Fe(II) oxygenase [Pirellulales bacterium]